MVEFSRFAEIGNCGGNEENGDVDPVGRFADHSVVGIEDDGDKDDPKQNPAELDTPKIIPVTEEYALHNGKKKRRPKEELHVLPRGFVYS